MRLQPGETVPRRVVAGGSRSDPASLPGLVDRVEARGALRRWPGRTDRRVKTITLTVEGRRLRAAFWERLTHDPGPIAPLSDAQVRQLCDLLSTALGLPVADQDEQQGNGPR